MFRRSAAKGDGMGKLMKPGDAGLLDSYPADPTRSNLFTADELAEYVKAYKKQGFLPSLQWYRTTQLNWHEEEGLPTDIVVPALMVTAGRDNVLTYAMTEGPCTTACACRVINSTDLLPTSAGMEGWVPKLKRGHVAGSSHWMMVYYPYHCTTCALCCFYVSSLNVASIE
jgi:soluble epoxide hydrolase/lipid-phosphate phosphatase